MKRNSIIILGDICPAWGYPQQFATGNPENVFHDILPILAKADVIIANLEAPLTLSEEKLKKNSVCLKGFPNDADVLSKAGINGVSLANNHIIDYCIKGYHDTLAALDNNKIVYYGAGKKDAFNMPCLFTIGKKKIGVLAFAEREFNCAEDYDEGAYYWDDLTSPQLVANAKKQCDYLIIQYHGGIEHYIYPSPYLQRKCRVMADMGADFITCQHSHCIGTRERWNNCEILYGQGNTIFGYRNNNDSWNNGLLVEIEFTNDAKIKYIPIAATLEGEKLADKTNADKILEKMNNESSKILNIDFVKKEWEQFCDKKANEYLPMAFARGRVFNKLNRMTNGALVKTLTSSNSRRNVMNLIRCDAHREVLQTVLENDYYAN